MEEQLIRYRQELLERLNSIASDISKAAAAIPPGRLHEPLESGDSPHRVLAHLRAIGSKALSIRLQRILDEEEPFLPIFYDDQWMDAHYDPHEPLEKIIADYSELRREQLEMIKDLPPHKWNRTARHPWWGVKTLQWWVEQILRYDEEHLQKLREAGSRRKSMKLDSSEEL